MTLVVLGVRERVGSGVNWREAAEAEGEGKIMRLDIMLAARTTAVNMFL